MVVVKTCSKEPRIPAASNFIISKGPNLEPKGFGEQFEDEQRAGGRGGSGGHHLRTKQEHQDGILPKFPAKENDSLSS